jgi:hypothetical protein
MSNWISIVGTASLICAILFKWAIGQFDTRKMLESVAIILVFCGGITISGIITSKTHNPVTSVNNICHDGFPYTCAGWPMFDPVISSFVNIIIGKIGISAVLPSIMVGTLTSIFIWQKLIRGVWLGPLEVGGAFLSGIVFYISISYFTYLKDGAFDIVNSALSPFGDPNAGLNDFVKNWNDLNVYLAGVSWEKMNQSIFSSLSIDLPSAILGYFQKAVISMGTILLGLINSLFLIIQQAYMIIVPIGIIKSVFLFDENWKVALKGIFSYTFFCIALHIEGLLLSSFIAIDKLNGTSANIYSQSSVILYTSFLILFTSIVMASILILFVKKSILR